MTSTFRFGQTTAFPSLDGSFVTGLLMGAPASQCAQLVEFSVPATRCTRLQQLRPMLEERI